MVKFNTLIRSTLIIYLSFDVMLICVWLAPIDLSDDVRPVVSALCWLGILTRGFHVQACRSNSNRPNLWPTPSCSYMQAQVCAYFLWCIIFDTSIESIKQCRFFSIWWSRAFSQLWSHWKSDLRSVFACTLLVTSSIQKIKTKEVNYWSQVKIRMRWPQSIEKILAFSVTIEERSTLWFDWTRFLCFVFFFELVITRSTYWQKEISYLTDKKWEA